MDGDRSDWRLLKRPYLSLPIPKVGGPGLKLEVQGCSWGPIPKVGGPGLFLSLPILVAILGVLQKNWGSQPVLKIIQDLRLQEALTSKGMCTGSQASGEQ